MSQPNIVYGWSFQSLEFRLASLKSFQILPDTSRVSRDQSAQSLFNSSKHNFHQLFTFCFQSLVNSASAKSNIKPIRFPQPQLNGRPCHLHGHAAHQRALGMAKQVVAMMKPERKDAKWNSGETDGGNDQNISQWSQKRWIVYGGKLLEWTI